ncbi:hypothetical protein EON65_32995 [archaeon]|nr:MAG: hypothetical protein EON65_32995 [archaeon]
MKPVHGLNPRLVIPTVRGGGPAIMTWGCISTFGFHDLVLLDGTINAAGYVKILEDNLVPVIQEYFYFLRVLYVVCDVLYNDV